MIGAGDNAARAVADGLRNWARAGDFSRAGRRYYRRRGEVVQLIQLQGLGGGGAFFVNVALACDRLRLLAGLPIVERPEEWSCCFRRRLEQLLPDVPEEWPAGTPREAAATARSLVAALDRLRRTLDTITDLERLLGSGWLGERGAELGLRARIAYARGDHRAALDYVEREAAFFAGRRGMRVPDLIARYRLTALAAQVAQ